METCPICLDTIQENDIIKELNQDLYRHLNMDLFDADHFFGYYNGYIYKLIEMSSINFLRIFT